MCNNEPQNLVKVLQVTLFARWHLILYFAICKVEVLHIIFAIKSKSNDYSLLLFYFIFRPKENERIRNELEKAVHIIWNCGLPSPRVCKVRHLLLLLPATLSLIYLFSHPLSIL